MLDEFYALRPRTHPQNGAGESSPRKYMHAATITSGHFGQSVKRASRYLSHFDCGGAGRAMDCTFQARRVRHSASRVNFPQLPPQLP